MDPIGIPTYCMPSDPTSDEERAEAIAEGIWTGLRDKTRAVNFATELDASAVLGKVFRIVAQGQNDWEFRLTNGMKMTRHEHQVSVLREIEEVLDAEVQAIASIEFSPRTPTNPATLIAMGALDTKEGA